MKNTGDPENKENINVQHSEIYAAYLQTIISAENRRQQFSVIFLSVLAIIITISSSLNDINNGIIYFLVILICINWIGSILYFRNLAQSKFEAVQYMEKMMAIHPFKVEWDSFKEKKVIPLTYLEMIIPLFLILGVVINVAYNTLLY